MCPLGPDQPALNSAAAVLLAVLILYLGARLRSVRAMLHTQIEINAAMAARLEKVEHDSALAFVAVGLGDLERERGRDSGKDFRPLNLG